MCFSFVQSLSWPRRLTALGFVYVVLCFFAWFISLADLWLLCSCVCSFSCSNSTDLLCSDISHMEKGKKIVFEEEDEEEPICIEPKCGPNDATVSLNLLGKLWTDRSYNTYGLFEMMKKVWNPSKGLSCNDLGFNLVSFQFNSERDMRRVLDMEPWQLNKHVLVLRRMTDETQPSAMVFNRAPFWMRIYDLP